MQASSATPRVIAGSGRSGTTWVLDALAEANGLRPVFEPLHPLAVPEAAAFAGLYLRSDAPAPEAEAFFRRLFAGEIGGVWTDYRVRPDRIRLSPGNLAGMTKLRDLRNRWRKLGRNYRRFKAQTRRPGLLVKTIRGNLLLGWLRKRFDAQVLLVLRHPGAVVESRMRLAGDDWDPKPELERYRADRVLYEDHLFRYDALLNRTLRPAEALTLVWCIENQIPLSQAAAWGIEVVFYEDLLGSGQTHWARVAAALGLRVVPDAAALSRPSQQSSELSRGTRIDETHSARWLERIEPAHLEQIEGVLRATGVEAYTARDPLPQRGLRAQAPAGA